MDLSICLDLIKEWLREGYTHLHFGVVRVVLSSHGCHNLPIAIKMALLNSNFLRYTHVMIGIVLSTLNAGSIVLMFFLNFNVPLKDLNLPTLLKIQIQMVGVELVSIAYAAILHHQLVYRLQNHALNLPYESFLRDPFLIATKKEIPTILQIPKQMTREEKRLLVVADPTFQTVADGQVKTSFLEPDSDQEIPSTTTLIFHTMDCYPSVCDPDYNNDLYNDGDDDDYYCSREKIKKKSPISTISWHRYYLDDPDNPWIAIKKPQISIYNKALQFLKKEEKEAKACYMFSLASISYDDDFRTFNRIFPKNLDFHYEKTSHLFYMLNGINESNLKQIYATSPPYEFQSELQRCPEKRVAELVQQFQAIVLSKADIESIYFKQSEEDEDITIALRYYPPSYTSEEDNSDDLLVLKAEPIHILSSQVISSLNIPVHILTSKYTSSIKAITYIDTGAHRTMMNPKILSLGNRVPHTEHFKVAESQVFETKWTSRKPIGIKFFPDCVIWTKVLGSNLPDVDILIGMDMYFQAQRLRILPNGISFKREFNPFIEQQKIYAMTDTIPSSFSELQSQLLKLCANNHSLF
ncbi:hypothetical protein FNV43_RR16778 [Rhamnella rubrinervis]|uniref:Uncharacterized protein n=1 Tax=Rhamnella rubrinervis TaxID=2594499 RepID=A0A8K0GZH2_9ROSA|nr:hypothetical protein FNV43_RR16778 [Rhamnella rubrinervis]